MAGTGWRNRWLSLKLDPDLVANLGSWTREKESSYQDSLFGPARFILVGGLGALLGMPAIIFVLLIASDGGGIIFALFGGTIALVLLGSWLVTSPLPPIVGWARRVLEESREFEQALDSILALEELTDAGNPGLLDDQDRELMMTTFTKSHDELTCALRSIAILIRNPQLPTQAPFVCPDQGLAFSEEARALGRRCRDLLVAGSRVRGRF